MTGAKDGGSDDAKSFAEIDKEAIEKYNKNMEVRRIINHLFLHPFHNYNNLDKCHSKLITQN